MTCIASRHRPSLAFAVVLFAACVADAAEGRPRNSADGPSNAEQYFLCLVNRARANPAGEAKRLGIALNEGLKRGTISDQSKQPLAFNPKLMTAARGHARWMFQHNTLSHSQGSSNAQPEQRMEAAGYVFTPPCGSGENIGFAGQTGRYAPETETVEQLYRGLFLDTDVPDRGHRINLLRPEFRETGVGIAKGMFRAQGMDLYSYLLTQDFAYAPGNAFLAGVVYSDTVKPDGFYTPGEGQGDVTITAVRQENSSRFSTTTWTSGGYTLSLPPGTYRVTFSGAQVSRPSDTTITLANQNVELDLRTR